jgi:hypothetical protein
VYVRCAQSGQLRPLILVAEAAAYLAALGKYTVVHQIVIGRLGVDS